MSLQFLLDRRNAIRASLEKIRDLENCLSAELAAADQQLTDAVRDFSPAKEAAK